MEPVSAHFRRRVQRRGPDVTAAMLPGSLLVLAPHPDDEVLGCGVLIMRKVDAGIPVHIVFATDGARSHELIQPERLIALRREEAIEAGRRLGLTADDLTFLNHPDGELRQVQGQLERELEELIRRHQPEVVVVTSHQDAHPDHQSLALAARAAIAGAGLTRALYEYPVWYWARLPWLHRPSGLVDAFWHFLRDPFVELVRETPHRVRTEGYLDRKRAALEAHASQIHPFPPGSESGPLLPPDFVDHFFQAHEVYFPIVLSDIDVTEAPIAPP